MSNVSTLQENHYKRKTLNNNTVTNLRY